MALCDVPRCIYVFRAYTKAKIAVSLCIELRVYTKCTQKQRSLRTRLQRAQRLATKAVERTALALQRVHDVHRGHRLAPAVLRIRHRVADHRLQKYLQNVPRLLVDEAGDALHTAAARQTPDSRLRNTLDVVAQNLAVALRTALPETLAALATT